MGTILGFLGFKSPFLKRLANYFLISNIFITSDLVCMNNNKKRLLYIIIVIVSIIGPFLISVYVLGQADLLPYRIKI